jgi:predicted phosphodiesterase
LGADLGQVQIDFLSDTHFGDPGCREQKIRNFLTEIADDPSRYLALNGDLINNALCTSVSDTYSETMSPQDQLDAVYEILLPVKDKILVANEGNHELRSYKTSGIRPIEQLCTMLYGKERAAEVYSVGSWLLYLSFGSNMGRDSRQTVYAIYGKHGSGGGKRIGSKMNRLEDMAQIVDADVFVHSHTHVPAVFKNSRFRVDYRNRKVTEHEQTFINTNAWLDFGGYGEECGFSPANTTPPRLLLTGRNRKIEVIL